MYLHRDELKRTARAPAKLNLFLEVLGRRDDGFHDVATVIVPIQLADTISFTAVCAGSDDDPRGRIFLDVRDFRARRHRRCDEPLPVADNLVVRALKLLQQQSGARYGARVELVKRIPLAAGLGGGSSDAAAALRLANSAWGLHWHGSQLSEIATELGSDVPFFLERGAAICSGRGERIARLPGMRPLHFVIVKPPLGLDTGDVYRAHDALCDSHVVPHRASSIEHPASEPLRSDHPPRRHPEGTRPATRLAAQLASGRWGDLARWMYNALQGAAATLTTWISEVSSVFNQFDFVAHQLTGSGSAYFGVCRHAQHARRLASILRTRQLGLVYATRSCQ
jgi:4-diphosphocytidyl-2-C-methyl-D-erythritol kinase